MARTVHNKRGSKRSMSQHKTSPTVAFDEESQATVTARTVNNNRGSKRKMLQQKTSPGVAFDEDEVIVEDEGQRWGELRMESAGDVTTEGDADSDGEDCHTKDIATPPSTGVVGPSSKAMLPPTRSSNAAAPCNLGFNQLKEIEESMVKAGQKMFMTIGTLLIDISAKQLYMQSGFSSMRDYLSSRQKTLGFSYKTGERCMLATRLVRKLPADCPQPTKISHILPLAHIGDELDIAECWRNIVKEAGGAGRVSMNKVEACVEKYVARRDAREIFMSKGNEHPLRIPTTPDYHMSNDWYTPTHILQKVRQVYGGHIDLDPCSDHTAQVNVKAKKYYTSGCDGLSKANKWSGNVFVNPPYGMYDHHHGMQEMFLGRATTKYESGNIKSCILLLKASVGSKWFQKVFDLPHAWLKDRLSFMARGSEGGKAQFGSVLVYVGPDAGMFVSAFTDVCFVAGKNSWSMTGVQGQD